MVSEAIQFELITLHRPRKSILGAYISMEGQPVHQYDFLDFYIGHHDFFDKNFR